MSNTVFMYFSFSSWKYFLEQGFWFPTPLKHTQFTWQWNMHPINLPSCSSQWKWGGPWLPVGPEVCDGSIKIIKVSLPAVHASCSWADSESSSENRAAPLMVQTGFSCLLESSCSQVLWLWGDLCRCTGTHTPPFFALFFFFFFSLQGILRIRILWVIFPACCCSAQLAFSCLHLRFFETVPPLLSWSTSNTTEL